MCVCFARASLGHGSGNLVHAVGDARGKSACHLRPVTIRFFSFKHDSLGDSSPTIGSVIKSPLKEKKRPRKRHGNRCRSWRINPLEEPFDRGLSWKSSDSAGTCLEGPLEFELCRWVGPIGNGRPVFPGKSASGGSFHSVGHFPCDVSHNLLSPWIFCSTT